MSDAFNNYCIACDQLCSPSSVYCSQACRDRDEHSHSSPLSSTELVSPLLTPSLYQPSYEHGSLMDHSVSTEDLHNSPLLLAATDDSNVRDLSLNYSVSQAPVLGPLASTSHNYRLWLGVL